MARRAAQTLRWVVIPAMLFLFAGAWAAQDVAGSLNKSEVRLVRSQGGLDAIVTFHLASHTLSLRVEPKPETGAHPLPMTRRLELWRPLIDQLLREHPGAEIHLLTVGEYPELGARIAGAAACSGNWNPRTGKPRSGNAAKAIKALLDDHSVYQELDSFFDALGYRTSVESAESVVLCPGKQFAGDEIHLPCQAKLQSEALVPCGASLVFRLVNKTVP